MKTGQSAFAGALQASVVPPPQRWRRAAAPNPVWSISLQPGMTPGQLSSTLSRAPAPKSGGQVPPRLREHAGAPQNAASLLLGGWSVLGSSRPAYRRAVRSGPSGPRGSPLSQSPVPRPTGPRLARACRSRGGPYTARRRGKGTSPTPCPVNGGHGGASRLSRRVAASRGRVRLPPPMVAAAGQPEPPGGRPTRMFRSPREPCKWRQSTKPDARGANCGRRAGPAHGG